MKRCSFALALLVVTALAAPIAADAKAHGNDALRVRVALPIVFSDPTSACPAGVADYRLTLNGATGSGTNCLQSVTPVDCPPGSDAFFCSKVEDVMTFRLPGGTIEAVGGISEADACSDPDCATLVLDQQWFGDVTRATHRFHKLNGGSVAGGGQVVADAATFEILSADEVLVIDD